MREGGREEGGKGGRWEGMGGSESKKCGGGRRGSGREQEREQVGE